MTNPTDDADLRPRVDLTGRVALVTGASRGLGAATARRLAAMGAAVVITYRREEAQAEQVADAIRGRGGTAWVHPLDLGDPDSIDALFDVFDAGGAPDRLDVLVANAAATSLKPLMEQGRHNVERTFAISVDGFLHAVQRAVPLMEPRGGGRIVVVSGIDTVSWAPAHGLLAAAKSAMESLVRYLTCELGEQGITAIGVNPDAFLGESVRLMLGEHYESLVEVSERLHPLRQIPTPDDIAEVVALLCTDAATWLAGNTVMADGAGSFSQRGQAMALTAALPDDVRRRIAQGRPPEDTVGDAPSVPTL